MAIYKVGESNFEKVDETTFAAAGIKERDDIQRLLKESIDVIAPDSLVIAEEFAEWTGSQRRIDLLAIDKDANLVVIELKRTQDGGYMELQALRYASMISAMTFRRAVEVFADYLGETTASSAEAKLLKFLDWDEPKKDDFANDVRIVLASAEFSRELTTSVLWLNDKGMDIRCIRIKPYQSNAGVLVNVEQVIPLPEAEEYQIGIREKRQEQHSERVSRRDTTRRDLKIDGAVYQNLPKRRIIFEVISAAIRSGADMEEIRNLMPKNKWVVVDGEFDSEDFIVEAKNQAAQLGRKFDAKRFFAISGEPFQLNGKTYALSKMWGRRTQEVVSNLADKFSLDVEIDW